MNSVHTLVFQIAPMPRTPAPRPSRNGRRAVRFHDETFEWEYWSVRAQAWYFLTAEAYDACQVRRIAARTIYGCDINDVLMLSYSRTRNDARVNEGAP